MRSPSDKASEPTPAETRRGHLILATESAFVGVGFLLGVLVFVQIAVHVKIAGITGYGWSGCLSGIAGLIAFAIFVCTGIVFGWWLWLAIFAKRLAVTKEEIYWLCVGPFTTGIPIMSRVCLRIAGISKADEKKLRDARRNRN